MADYDESENLKVAEEELDLDENGDNTEEIGEIQHPFSTKDIKITNAIISLSSIVTRLQHGEIDLNPDFQRNADLWNSQKMSRLIESIILRLPLPIFYFDVSDPDKWLVIDGLQRLSTIRRFIVDKKMKLRHLEFLNHLENKSYDDLDRSIQRVIEETQIITYQIEPQTPKDVKYSIFNRINTGGMSLNAQEVRQALNQKGVGVEFLRQVAEEADFKRIVHVTSKRMLDRELVLRFIAWKMNDYKTFSRLKSSLGSMLDETMEIIDTEKDISRLDDYRESLLVSLRVLEKLFPHETLFNKKLVNPNKTGTLNRSLFEIWTVLISNLNLDQNTVLIARKDQLLANYKELLDTPEFDDAITKGTNDKKAIVVRFTLLEMMLHGIINAN